jgi:hypothetical protein
MHKGQTKRVIKFLTYLVGNRKLLVSTVVGKNCWCPQWLEKNVGVHSGWKKI